MGLVWCTASVPLVIGFVGWDFVMAIDFLSETFISDDVVVVSLGFVISAVGGTFSSVDAAADDVRAFMVTG